MCAKFLGHPVQSPCRSTPSASSPYSQARREGGGVFPGPATFGGPPSLKSTESVFRMAFFWPEICIKSIFGSAPDPAWELMTRPRSLVGWWEDTPSNVSALPTPSTSRSRHIRNEVMIGPRDNGFPGPAVALDGPVTTSHKFHVSRVRCLVNPTPRQ